MMIHRKLDNTRGVIYAALVGIIVPTIVNGVTALVTSSPLNLGEEWAVILFQCVIVFLPFFLISAAGVGTLLSWVVGLVLTLGLWGYAFIDPILRRGTGTGANIGLGLIIFVSPVIITAACLAVGRYGVTRSDHEGRSVVDGGRS